MDWSLILGIVAGIGTTVGTLAALEQYGSKKFIWAVKNAITELDIDRNIRHLKTDYSTLSQEQARFMGEVEEQLARCKDANLRQHAQINELKIHIEKLESAIRLLCDCGDQKTINVLLNSTAGTHGQL